jgi:ribonuclease HI
MNYNVDCALFNNNTITGLGICVRDSSRALLFGFLKYSYFNSFPSEAESLGLFEAINIAINRHMTSVIFESDCRLLVDTIDSNSTPHNEFGDIISRCKDLLSSRNNFIVSYVRRQANKVVRNIVRASLSHHNPHIFHDVPSCLYLLLFNEMN